jgi:predicted ATP-grasp superfamily ATP-dependent carboligase
LLLASNRQEIAIGKDGVATLMALEVNRFGDPDGSLADLARRIAQALPGLWGYVGVDYLETASGPVVLEINPRPTTSCCGLRPALGLNLASLVLALDSPGALAVRGRVLTGEPYRINLVTSDAG